VTFIIEGRSLLYVQGCAVGLRIIPDSAVEGEAKSKAQAFRSERNGPVPLSQVASSGAMSGVLDRCARSAE
jgi:hypothetical protein